jgi:hypothetical protein
MQVSGVPLPIVRTWLVGMLLLAMLETAIAEPRQVQVLLLHSFGPSFQPRSAIASRFREDLIEQSPYGIDLYEASLQTARLEQPSDEAPFLEYLGALFRESGLDLIVILVAPATRFFQTYRSELLYGVSATSTTISNGKTS